MANQSQALIDKVNEFLSPNFDKLVNREKQVEAFRQALVQVRSQGAVRGSKNLFEWYGGPGIGKSTLLRLLQRECEKMDIPSSLVSFLKLKASMNRYLEDPTQLLELIVKNLDPQPSKVLKQFYTLVAEYRASEISQNVIRAYFQMSPDNRLYKRPNWLKQLREITIAFLEVFKDWAEKSPGQAQPIVFMFDETESADIELADWIEEWVISPLLKFDHCIVIWTSRRRWRWKRPEVRKRLQSDELTVFEDDAVKHQMAAASSQELAEALFGNVRVVTRGHPFANAVVISELSTLGSSVTPENFAEYEAKFYGAIFDIFINGYVLKGFEHPLPIVCRLLAMVRLFNTAMLREVLHGAREGVFPEEGQEYYGDLMYTLKKTQLLEWDKSSYTIDPDLRYLIQQYYFSCEPDVYFMINELALEVYREWLAKPVDNRGLFVVEELYHLACQQRVGKEVDLGTVFQERLDQYKKWFQDPQALRNALESLRGELEHDDELRQLTGGLSSVDLVQKVNERLDGIVDV